MAITASIAQYTPGCGDVREATHLRTLLESALADLTALRTSITTLTAKLDADAGVTDTNYAATCDPAALKLTA